MHGSMGQKGCGYTIGQKEGCGYTMGQKDGSSVYTIGQKG